MKHHRRIDLLFQPIGLPIEREYLCVPVHSNTQGTCISVFQGKYVSKYKPKNDVLQMCSTYF